MGNLGFRIGIEGFGGGVAKRPLLFAPALMSSRGAANTWLRLRSFDLPALVFSTDQNLSGRRAAASWRGGASVRMRAMMREAVLSDVRQVDHIVQHCASEWARTVAQMYWVVVGGVERGVGKRDGGRVILVDA